MSEFLPRRHRGKSARVRPPMRFGMTIGKADNPRPIVMSRWIMEKSIGAIARHGHNEGGSTDILGIHILEGERRRG